jgi:hypothetical protein
MHNGSIPVTKEDQRNESIPVTISFLGNSTWHSGISTAMMTLLLRHAESRHQTVTLRLAPSAQRSDRRSFSAPVRFAIANYYSGMTVNELSAHGGYIHRHIPARKRGGVCSAVCLK